MANCNHAGATCIIGQFWTCSTVGCPNGPAVPPKFVPVHATGSSGVIEFSAMTRFADYEHIFDVERHPLRPGAFVLYAKPGYGLAWDDDPADVAEWRWVRGYRVVYDSAPTPEKLCWRRLEPVPF